MGEGCETNLGPDQGRRNPSQEAVGHLVFVVLFGSESWVDEGYDTQKECHGNVAHCKRWD